MHNTVLASALFILSSWFRFEWKFFLRHYGEGFVLLLYGLEKRGFTQMTEIIWIVNHFQGIYVLTHMRTEEDQMYFCLFFYVLLVTIENSPIPRPVFPSSSSGVLSEKEGQEENRLLAASTGPTQQTPAIISQRNSSFSEKNFFQFLSLLIFLGINSWQTISTPVSPSSAGWLFCSKFMQLLSGLNCKAP